MTHHEYALELALTFLTLIGLMFFWLFLFPVLADFISGVFQ